MSAPDNKPRQLRWIRKIARWISYAAAAFVIVLALLVGIARLLLPIVPEYRADIRQWAEQATGLDIEFERISASWPISGPELSLSSVTVADADTATRLFEIENLRVGISIIALLRDRAAAPGRIVVQNVRAEIERTIDGKFFLQGQPFDEVFDFEMRSDRELPNLTVKLSDIVATYRDARFPERTLDVEVEELDVDVSPNAIEVEAEAQLSDAFGDRLTLSASLPGRLAQALQNESGPAERWQLYAAGNELALVPLLELAGLADQPVSAARGDVTVWADMLGRRLMNLTIESEIVDALIQRPEAGEAAYPELSGRLEWERRVDGWLLSGSGIGVAFADRTHDDIDFRTELSQLNNEDVTQVVLRANTVPLDALYPLADSFLPPDWREQYLPVVLSGDVRGLDAELATVKDQAPEYRIKGAVANLSIALDTDGPAATGITAEIEADEAGGRLELASGRSSVTLPTVFAETLDVESLTALFIWRVTQEQVRVLSDSVQIVTPHATGTARVEMEFPRAGGPPNIDLSGSAKAEDASQTVRYLPLQRFPPEVSQWLNRAVVGGRVRNADIEVRGPLAEFPFRGDEGVFRIDVDFEQATLDFADEWPAVEQANGRLVFEGVSIFSNQNAGVIGGLPFSDRLVRIQDLANGVLEIAGRQRVQFNDALGFLRVSPVAELLGPVLDRVGGNGELDVDFDLKLPLARLNEPELKIDAQALGNDVGLDGVNFGFTAVDGTVKIRNDAVSAAGIKAQLLGEPVRVDIRPADRDDKKYSHVATVAGITPIDKWTQTLSLPFPERLSGSLPWRAIALIPAQKRNPDANLHILIDSNLDGLSSEFPRPFAKRADQQRPMKLDLGFTAERQIDVIGDLQNEYHFALRLKQQNEQWQIERSAVHAGEEAIPMPVNPGVQLTGRFAYLNLDECLELAEGEPSAAWQALYKEITIGVDELAAFGLVFRDLSVDAATGEIDWRVNVDGPTASGRLTVPLDATNGRPLELDMRRLLIAETDDTRDGATDPRELRPARVYIEDFGIGDMRFGELDTNVSPVPDGILVNPLQMRGPTFTIEGEGAWLVQRADEDKQRSRLRMAISSTDIKATLGSLGYDPIIEGEKAAASLDVTWPGGPSRDFLDNSRGTFEMKMERGMLLELEPGGGRLLGVFSIAALPRRLSLDFSDVLDDGLGFDTLQGRFDLDQGDAYTCNLSLEGSVTDLGIVGRAGLSNEDYEQIAVVRPHVSNVLPIGGAVVGGPGVGAAMWIFSQIFKKPLSTLGESYYEVTGGWDEPTIKRLQSGDLDSAAFTDCEQYIATLAANSE